MSIKVIRTGLNPHHFTDPRKIFLSGGVLRDLIHVGFSRCPEHSIWSATTFQSTDFRSPHTCWWLNLSVSLCHHKARWLSFNWNQTKPNHDQIKSVDVVAPIHWSSCLYHHDSHLSTRGLATETPIHQGWPATNRHPSTQDCWSLATSKTVIHHTWWPARQSPIHQANNTITHHTGWPARQSPTTQDGQQDSHPPHFMASKMVTHHTGWPARQSLTTQDGQQDSHPPHRMASKTVTHHTGWPPIHLGQ